MRWHGGGAGVLVLRVLLAGLALLLCPAAPSLRLSAQALPNAARHIEPYLSARLQSDKVPGGAVVLVGPGGARHIAVKGVADPGTGHAVSGHTLFEIGSLSKTFTALALLQMREEGVVDLDRGVTAYLPWLRPSAVGSVTLHHLLTHTAGLPRDQDDIPSSPYAAAALHERWPVIASGRRFAYSNLGYQLLSLLMEEVEGRPFPEVVRRRVLVPLGMDSSAAAITNALRIRLATGHQYFYDDRPPHTAHPVVPATWAEHGAGDANVAATPADLASFLSALLAGGEGVNGRVVERRSLALLTSRAVPAPPLGSAARYGYGVIADSLDGRALLWNSGATLGFRAWFGVDPEAGAAVAVVMNGPGSARRLGEFALRTLRAALASEPLPPPPGLPAPTLVGNAPDYAGDYTGELGDSVRFEAEGNTLAVVLPEGRVVLERLGSDRFYADTPRFALFPLQFGRDSSGVVVDVAYGGEWWANARHRGPRRFDYPRGWVAYLGHYRSAIPWFSNFRVLVRKGVLLMVAPEGTEEPLVPLGETGEFRIGVEPESPERIRFDTVISGRALRATLSGVAYYRSFTP